MEKILAPSILAADIMRLGEQIEAVKNAGAKYLHIDVMDGMFVPALSYGMCVVESIRKSCDMVLDVHLMIVEPGRHVEAFAKAGADIITIHLEACADAHEVIRQIHSCGCKAGVSIKPGTPIEVLEEYLEWLHDFPLGGEPLRFRGLGRLFELYYLPAWAADSLTLPADVPCQRCDTNEGGVVLTLWRDAG